MNVKFLLSIYYLCISSWSCFVKSSAVNEEHPFRMRKVSVLWEKAKRIGLSQEKMNNLYVELERQDRDERKWKHQKHNGKDKYGEMEAILRSNLVNIMTKYGLVVEKKDKGSEPTGDHIHTNRVQDGAFVKDNRLEKLWEYAKSNGGFTKQELEDLRIELGHHHDKWKQFKDLVNLVSSYEDNENVVDNSLPDYKDIAKLRDEMDVKQRQVENSYRRLKVKVLQGAVDEEYHDYRVRDLWKRAKAQGLSGDELDIIKEELRHFDNKIVKHDDLQEQLDFAQDLLDKGHDHLKGKHEKLTAKVQEHRRYIKKLYATYDSKIGPHNEL